MGACKKIMKAIHTIFCGKHMSVIKMYVYFTMSRAAKYTEMHYKKFLPYTVMYSNSFLRPCTQNHYPILIKSFKQYLCMSFIQNTIFEFPAVICFWAEQITGSHTHTVRSPLKTWFSDSGGLKTRNFIKNSVSNI